MSETSDFPSPQQDNVSSRELEGKVALVTGSTSGIGLGIIQNLARIGCHVIVHGFGEPDLVTGILSDLKRFGSQVHYFDDDLSATEGNSSLCDNVFSIFPNGINILVNNAGIQHVCPVEEFPESKWNKMINIMLTSPFLLTQRFLPSMREAGSVGWGRIINISSVHGLVASPNKAAYVSAKHGLLGLTKVVALETAGSGVTCNSICPGFVDTPIFQGQVEARSIADGCSYEDASKRILQQVHPSLAPVGVDQVAKFVEFVCSDAASQMTGSSLTMDGGWTAR